jgi:arginyl-tRNA--protein-N-Asp/Glu arginylyltransferase
MYQTRSLRINLELFELSSENRRILSKTQDLSFIPKKLPLIKSDYNWNIHKIGKDFYHDKLQLAKAFSANKIRELVLDGDKSNFNLLLEFGCNGQILGYAICYENSEILQYAYPFYDYINYPNNYGMGMILSSIEYAKNKGCKYLYLGSVSRKTDVYKFQFKGLEWFDSQAWQHEKIDELKNLLIN